MVTPISVFKGGCGPQEDDPVQAVLLLRRHPRLAGLHQHGMRHGRPGGQADPKETHRTTHWILLPVHRHAPHSVWIGIHFLRQRPHEVGQGYLFLFLHLLEAVLETVTFYTIILTYNFYFTTILQLLD